VVRSVRLADYPQRDLVFKADTGDAATPFTLSTAGLIRSIVTAIWFLARIGSVIARS
jgi:hypothetical protein